MAGTETKDTAGDPTPLDERQRAIRELEALLTSSDFRAKYISVQMRARRIGEDEAMRELGQLASDLIIYRDRPEFQAALDVWGRSRNMKEDRGEDDRGYHAGIVHYFEYRAGSGKTKRYLEGEYERPSIQGFIEFSQELGSLINNPHPDNNNAIEVAVRVGDT